MTNRTLDELISIWNHATNPAALRTDHEHRRNRQLARAAKRRIDAGWQIGFHYVESDYTSKLVRL